jgi:hypothetical protein
MLPLQLNAINAIMMRLHLSLPPWVAGTYAENALTMIPKQITDTWRKTMDITNLSEDDLEIILCGIEYYLQDCARHQEDAALDLAKRIEKVQWQ